MLPNSLVLVAAVARLAITAAETGTVEPAPQREGGPAPRAPGSVYLIKPEVDAPLLASTAALWGVLALAGPDWVVPKCPCSSSKVPGFDRVALGKNSQAADTISSVTEGLAVAIPVLVDWFEVGGSAAFAEDLLVYAEAVTISGAAVELAKYTVQRPRPYAYDSSSPEVIRSPESYVSFFSGHTTTAFAALTAFSMTQSLRHGPRVWLWILTAVVGTSVAIERVLAGKHFPSDVIAGTLVGVSTGVLVPWFHAFKPAGEASLGASRSPDGTVFLVARGVW